MNNSILVRIRQGHRTTKYPSGPPPTLPERFRGLPAIDSSKCVPDCDACVQSCPTEAITLDPLPVIDLGRCLFCPECTRACPTGALTFGPDYRLATRERRHLVVGTQGGAESGPGTTGGGPDGERDGERDGGRDGRRYGKRNGGPDGGRDGGRAHDELQRAEALGKELRRLLGRSLKLRQVSAGGCNACELDTNVLGTIGWDLGRFGIQFVASPRHADGILVTGAISENMRVALAKTWEAIPAPKIVIAVGACAISGGPFRGHDEVHDGIGDGLRGDVGDDGGPVGDGDSGVDSVRSGAGAGGRVSDGPAGGAGGRVSDGPVGGAGGRAARSAGVSVGAGAGGRVSVVPVDLYIPGCPPHPLTILDGLLRLLGRVR